MDVYLYDPRDPNPNIGGLTMQLALAIGANAGPRDQRAAEQRPDLLMYSSEIQEQAVEVTGPISVTLYAATSTPDKDFVARLFDVHPDGTSRILAEGIIRARYREVLDQARPITPGEVYEYTIDLMATSNVFRPGHQLRVDITSSSFPRFDRNLNTGMPIGEDTLEDAQVALQTIFHNTNRPSHIVLPIIPV